MIVSLQKRHQQIWTIFAIVLPVLVVIAYFSIPEKAYTTDREDYSLLPTIFDEREDDNFKIIQRKLEREQDIQYQLQVIIKEPLQETASLVFISENEDIGNKEAIGQIFTKGSYSFGLFDPLQTNDKVIFYNPQTEKVFHVMD